MVNVLLGLQLLFGERFFAQRDRRDASLTVFLYERIVLNKGDALRVNFFYINVSANLTVIKD